MSVLIPLVFLIGGFFAVMVMLYRNLQRLDRQAGEAWQRVQEMRGERLDVWSTLIVALHTNAVCDAAHETYLDRKINTCRQVDGAAETARADSSLSLAWHDFAMSVDMRTIYALPAARDAIDRLHTSNDAALGLERLYNNAATLYNNAGITFPALLVAKQAHFEARQLYYPQRVRRASGDTSFADRESLAEKSPRIMNAYMLWAVGMSDMTMEEVPSDTEVPPL